jgi:glutaredoxin
VSREVTLYTRTDCGLCHEAAAELRRLQPSLRFELHEVDIDDDPVLRERYTDVIPVIAIDGRVIAQAPIDRNALRAALARALGG